MSDNVRITLATGDSVTVEDQPKGYRSLGVREFIPGGGVFKARITLSPHEAGTLADHLAPWLRLAEAAKQPPYGSVSDAQYDAELEAWAKHGPPGPFARCQPVAFVQVAVAESGSLLGLDQRGRLWFGTWPTQGGPQWRLLDMPAEPAE